MNRLLASCERDASLRERLCVLGYFDAKFVLALYMLQGVSDSKSLTVLCLSQDVSGEKVGHVL